ncbi:low molecular weight phosphatase family protein [Kiritimatiella glycovorans]|uniref:protein-tyrosine-phosphatase n=1 Tax=Kiritimatiella glycovorans TaxID=1307763 RepID=A0A0G3EGC1_9BACT|nr:low molecular weight phosphatase family protein [Kiritimatiella glycovorans]AKJ65388.1 Low molecular weight protein-tyrosine-phosphatase ptp [Kiritimatiella glycovorans]
MFPFKRRFHILIVCRNNVTRSAFFEGYLIHYLRRYRPRALRKIALRSAGVQASEGNSAHAVVQFIARREGFRLTGHRSTPLSDRLLKWADLVLTMSAGQRDEILANWPETDGGKVYRLADYGWGEEDGGDLDMPDPTGREAEDFQGFVDRARTEADRLLYELVHRQII